jgi:adenylyltransferase/sulfurtransferase
LLIFDAMGMDFTKVSVKWDPECPVCGKNPTITEPIDYDQFCGIVTSAASQAAQAVT